MQSVFLYILSYLNFKSIMGGIISKYNVVMVGHANGDDMFIRNLMGGKLIDVDSSRRMFNNRACGEELLGGKGSSSCLCH